MSRRGNKSATTAALLDLWRPPDDAGDPIGCLATTYTFTPGLFDEQCLARFLRVDSDSDREGLSYVLERANRLGAVYAGVLVDHTQAGVEHSLRWDVLPVRIRAGKQHAKLSLLAWTHHVRLIVASANLTEPGYRTNHEVAGVVDLTPSEADQGCLEGAMALLRALLRFVPGASGQPPEIRRAHGFLSRVEALVRDWPAIPRRTRTRQQLLFTLPALGSEQPAWSALEGLVEVCRRRGGLPDTVRVASPFFDVGDGAEKVTSALCKLMARKTEREITFCLPEVPGEPDCTTPRIAAPDALLTTPKRFNARVSVELLPYQDADQNPRRWHAKMVHLRSAKYSALLVGSSNFTCAGMGVGHHRNAEANLLTLVVRGAAPNEASRLYGPWRLMRALADPENAEWWGAQPEDDEEASSETVPLPAGFLSATYAAGANRRVLLQLDPEYLPRDWALLACEQKPPELLTAEDWVREGRSASVEIAWESEEGPERLLVRWDGHEAFIPVNVEDSRALPPPRQFSGMSADELLAILAASDTGAAFRAWARRQRSVDHFDDELDSAEPIDLDPLRRHDLQSTFLHRIRRRARVLARLREHVGRPAWSRQALDWRLRGHLGIQGLAERFCREFQATEEAAGEALLALADLLIVLRETEYQAEDGALPREAFEEVFRPFLHELTGLLASQVQERKADISPDLLGFWHRMLERKDS